ncbi:MULTISPECIES: hypothetical protein [unclassified Marinovum]
MAKSSLLVGALALLAGCLNSGPKLALIDRPAAGGGGFFSGLTRPKVAGPSEPVTRAQLAKGDVVIDAPDGWCVEQQSLRDRGQRGFALLVGCRAVTAGESGARVPFGAATVSVSSWRAPGELSAPEVLRAVVGVGSVLSQETRDGVALVQLRQTALPTEDGLGDPHWRGVFVHRGRTVLLAAFGPPGGEISQQGGAALLAALAEGIRSNSPAD